MLINFCRNPQLSYDGHEFGVLIQFLIYKEHFMQKLRNSFITATREFSEKSFIS